MKIYANFLTILILFALLAACAPVRVASEIPVIPEGQVVGLQMGQVIYGIQQAIADKAGTKILTDGNGHYVFNWVTSYSGNFACFSAQGNGCAKDILKAIKAGGNAVNVKSMTDLENFLIEKGYKPIKSDELPEVIKIIFSGAFTQIMQMATNWGTFLIVPAGIFTIPEDLQPQVQEIG